MNFRNLTVKLVAEERNTKLNFESYVFCEMLTSANLNACIRLIRLACFYLLRLKQQKEQRLKFSNSLSFPSVTQQLKACLLDSPRINRKEFISIPPTLLFT